MVIQAIKIFFVQYLCVFLPWLLISSATISVLYCAHLWMKCSFNISNFIEEISTISPSVVFLYFFALFIEEGLLVYPCYSLELCM